ncbi:MAG TPA: 16S rRNA (cytidine(1402)-2'-O)-methyltransferase [Candidatus Paceibacterota bacterium]|nr:16S rRNA (cytidine(1402)-2'-O)-methyltransferase [Candidatus Paceibacterota bacterium]
MLYIVATPIGNLEDITLRAIRVLAEVDFILAEDTRNTRKLLNHLEIKTPTISFHEHSRENDYEKIFQLLRDGKKLALVTDAGTPAISDPGSKLVARIQEMIVSGELSDIKVISIPGPSSLTAAISIAGIKKTSFYFAGFSPHKKGRETFFKNLSEKIDDETFFVFFESPHRIMKAIESLKKFSPDKNVVIVKEVSKIFEEVFAGKPAELAQIFQANPDKLRGEFVIMVY